MLFKNAFRDTLGSEIVDRPKQGFSVPLAKWLRGPLRELVEESVFADDARVQNWLDMNAVRAMWTSHLRGTGDMGSMIWAVLMLEHWARNFLTAGSSALARSVEKFPQPVVSHVAGCRDMKLSLIVGARPNFMKIAPLLLRARCPRCRLATDSHRPTLRPPDERRFFRGT